MKKTKQYHIKKSIAILYEDEDIIIINKENSCLVHSDGQSIDTVANHLSYYYVKSCQNLTVRPVHRLDYETSGMVIFAKNFLSHAYLSYLLENRKIIKVYECLCENSFKEKVGIINANIGKNRHEDKQIITKKGQSALTKYKVMSNKETLSMLEVTIKTGRKHQIRVHLSSIKHPIVGDVMYGARPSDRLYLHFSYIKFVHPRTMKTFEYQCKSNFGEK